MKLDIEKWAQPLNSNVEHKSEKEQVIISTDNSKALLTLMSNHCKADAHHPDLRNFVCASISIAVPESECLSFLIANNQCISSESSYFQNNPQIEELVADLYKRYADDFGKYQKAPTPSEKQTDSTKKTVPKLSRPENGTQDSVENANAEENEIIFADTPTIPSSVYDALPSLLKEACQAFSTDRERDVFLTSSLAVLSGCFPTVSGVYDAAAVFANLYSFIPAPAASGKGVMKYARRFGMTYHKSLREGSEKAWMQYEIDLNDYNASKKKNPSAREPLPPPDQLLYFPSNTSAAMFVQNLKESNGKGILFETEADTLSGALAQDWGNFSDGLRKGFHHEPITSTRKGTGKKQMLIEVEHPQLSVCLSGTPAQVQRLIPNVEDGLFSRFLFYAFSTPPVWRDVSPFSGRSNLDDLGNKLDIEGFRMIESALTIPHVHFELSRSQWNNLNKGFSDWLGEIAPLIPDAVASIKRLGLSTFRIAMILSILRQFEDGTFSSKFVCEDIDFDSALALANIYRTHMIALVERMPQQKIKPRFADKANKAKQAVELKSKGFSFRQIEEMLGVPKSTLERWLK